MSASTDEIRRALANVANDTGEPIERAIEVLQSGDFGLPRELLASAATRLLAIPRLAPSAVVVGADDFARAPKFIVPYSWAFGAPAPGRTVKIDDDAYAKAPIVAADIATRRTKIVSRTAALLPAAYLGKPHQASFAFEREDVITEPMALPLALAMSTNYAINVVAAKEALAILADPAICRGAMASETLGELARVVHGGVARVRPQQVIAAAAGLATLRDLFFYLPDGGIVQLFDVKMVADPRPDMRIHMGLTRTALISIREQLGEGTSFNGTFLFNFSGAMRLPNEKPQLLRHLIRSSAHWNAAFHPVTHKFDRSKLPEYDVEKWAIVANALPPAVVGYIESDRRGTKGRAVALSHAKKTVRSDLECLAHEHKLIRVELHHAGRRDERLVILPPPAWTEAKDEELRRAGDARRQLGLRAHASRAALLVAASKAGTEDPGGEALGAYHRGLQAREADDDWLAGLADRGH